MLQWWNKLVRFLYNRALHSKLTDTTRNTRITNLADAKTVGLLYNSTLADNDIVVTQFADSLKAQGKQVEILGYINDPKVQQKADIPLFNKKEVNWYGVPTGEKATRFAQQKFDLLLACYTNEELPLEFISATSAARWRVGPYHPAKTDCYDLMVNMGNKTDLPYFIAQATNFLNQLQYDTVKA